jgi:hypothetical protein
LITLNPPKKLTLSDHMAYDNSNIFSVVVASFSLCFLFRLVEHFHSSYSFWDDHAPLDVPLRRKLQRLLVEDLQSFVTQISCNTNKNLFIYLIWPLFISNFCQIIAQTLTFAFVSWPPSWSFLVSDRHP